MSLEEAESRASIGSVHQAGWDLSGRLAGLRCPLLISYLPPGALAFWLDFQMPNQQPYE
jgi:hypothetical protein